MTGVQGHRFIALEGEQSTAAFPADCSSAGAATTPAHATSPDKAGPLPVTKASPRPRKRKPPKAKPHTRCTLCDRVGRAETFIFSQSTGAHYCVDFDKCDRKRGVTKSRKAP